MKKNSKIAGVKLKNRKVLLILLPLIFIACANFNYFYYGFRFPASGKVDDLVMFVPKGSAAKKDLPFTVCKPDEASSGKCVGILTADFFSIINSNETCLTQLSECQRSCKP